MSRPPGSDKRLGWHWTDYWRSGRAEVMTVDSAAGSTPFDTAPVWRDFFGTFPDGARLLDLATGGGQVARIASGAAAAAGKTFEVVGVDYADLGPSAGPSPDGFTLIPRVSLEKLPFPPDHFDGATSQFGIEYADARAALAELARVLRPGGRAMMLIHHAQSAVSLWSARQAAAYDKVMGDGGALRQARRVFTAHRKRVPPPAVRAAEDSLREAVERAARRLEPDPAFEFARYLVGYLSDLSQRAAAYEPTSALRRLDEVEAGNAAWRQRHRSQLSAAMDEAGLAAFLQRAERSGLAVAGRGEEHDERGALIAWRVSLHKP